MNCTLNKIDSSYDWWCIERAEHDGREWMDRFPGGVVFMRASRLGNADIEGTGDEMLAIAEAIERAESAAFKRCAARHTTKGYLMSSPRNSTQSTLITHDEAKALAVDIRAKVGSP